MKTETLYIEYVIDLEKGTFFGWGSDKEKINPYLFPIYLLESTKKLSLEGTIRERTQAAILKFFNGYLSRDLNIPDNCPYNLYEKDKKEIVSSGKLRPK